MIVDCLIEELRAVLCKANKKCKNFVAMGTFNIELENLEGFSILFDLISLVT